MDKINQEMKQQLETALENSLCDEAVAKLKKKVEDAVEDAQETVGYDLKDRLVRELSAWVEQMAEDAVTQLLAGNEGQMRRYLSCDKPYGFIHTGRSDGYKFGNSEIERQHPVIHGSLFEQGCVKLRKSIVEAHRDLLVTERILDLEDQVKSLVAQNNKKDREIEGYRERVRSFA